MGSVIDVLTFGYRFVHHQADGPGGVSPKLVAPMTWLLGTVVTMMCLVAVAVVWDLALWVLRVRGRRLLVRATLGLNLRQARILVDQFVWLDRTAGVLQGIARVRQQRADRSSPDGLTQPARGSRSAALLLLIPLVIGWALRVVRYLLTTIWTVLTVAATWWAMGRPGLHGLRAAIVRWHAAGSLHLSATGLSAVGVSIAALTFVLSRLRSASVVGHQNWRRAEAAGACDELANRQIAISKTLATLREVEWDIRNSWDSAIWGFEEFTDRELADHESELRRLLQLDPSSLPVRVPRIDPAQFTAADRNEAVAEAVASLHELRKMVDEVTTRREDQIWATAPLRLTRLASTDSLSSAIAKIDPYVNLSHRSRLRLTSPSLHVRGLAATTLGRFVIGSDPRDSDVASIPETDRLALLATAKQQWQRDVEQARSRFEADAHRILIRGFIGMAELRAARNAIVAYLHPAGPVTKLREWLRPT